jgi:hypothetical protein
MGRALPVWDDVKKEAAKAGLWAILFVTLLAWSLRENNIREVRYIEREDRYVEVISTLSKEVRDRLSNIESRMPK